MEEQRSYQESRVIRSYGPSSQEERRRRKEEDVGGGRRVILVVFFLSLGLSFLFWLQGNLASWLREWWGPSEWTFRR